MNSGNLCHVPDIRTFLQHTSSQSSPSFKSSHQHQHAHHYHHIIINIVTPSNVLGVVWFCEGESGGLRRRECEWKRGVE
eukprot:3434870-Karenia_brevis.AAC.1